MARPWAPSRPCGRAAEASRHARPTRLLALAADQLALAIRRDELRREATEAEIARQSDALKSALLDSVSHDLRTPLAEHPGDGRRARRSRTSPDRRRRPHAPPGRSIAEAERLDRLVRELLDLSRIEAGALRPDVEALDLRDARRAGRRPAPAAARRSPDRRSTLADDLPPVRADAVLLDAIVANLLENVARHTPPPARAEDLGRALAATGDPARRSRTAGRACPTADARPPVRQVLPRAPAAARGRGAGMGVGLAIVRGLAEAMGGTVDARRERPRRAARSARPAGRRRTRRGRRAPAARASADVPPAARTCSSSRTTTRPGLRRPPTSAPTATASPRRATSPTALAAGTPTRPDFILLDLGLPDADGSASSGASGARRRRRSSSSRRGARSATRWPRSRPAPTTTSRSRSASPSCGRGSRRCSGGRAVRPADASGAIRLGPPSRSTSPRASPRSATPSSTSRPASTSCSRRCSRQPGRLLTQGSPAAGRLGHGLRRRGHYLHVYVSRLRRKLAAADPTGATRDLIVAEPGVGYRIAEADRPRRLERLLSVDEPCRGPLPLGGFVRWRHGQRPTRHRFRVRSTRPPGSARSRSRRSTPRSSSSLRGAAVARSPDRPARSPMPSPGSGAGARPGGAGRVPARARPCRAVPVTIGPRWSPLAPDADGPCAGGGMRRRSPSPATGASASSIAASPLLPLRRRPAS